MAERLAALTRRRGFFPLVIVGVGLAAYGAHLYFLGFYWDDWPWIWFSHVLGPQGMLKIDVEHRPLSGVVLFLGSLLAGESPLRWQLYNLAFRLGGALALYWMLMQIWPGERRRNIWVTLFFLVYPGFSHQFVSVNTSRHLFPLIPLFLSFGFTARAWGDERRYRQSVALALLLSLIAMFTTEYYYGLELSRAVLLWLLARRQTGEWRVSLKRAFIRWLPYFATLVGIFLWRYLVSLRVNYAIVIFDEVESQSVGLGTLLWQAVGDLLSSGMGAWLLAFRLPDPGMYGFRSRMLIWGAAGIVTMGVLLYLLFSYEPDENPSARREVLAFGALTLLVAPLPFWVTGLDPSLRFPDDRLNLPMMLGASLLLVWLIEKLFRRPAIRALVLALWIGLAVGYHNQVAISYRRDWQYQVAFFQQLTTRIPAMKKGTAILVNELPNVRSTDNSLTAPLNWAYTPDFAGGELPLNIFYIELRFGREETQVEGHPIFNSVYRFFPFYGDPSQTVVVYYRPPACLRVMDLQRDVYYPLLPNFVREVLPYSDPDRIVLYPERPAVLPPVMGRVPQPKNWCYYFERADLARQRGDWEEVARLGDIAFALDDSPNHASERIPFIEGYAHVGEWEKAVALSEEALQINRFMGPMLCETWERIAAETSSSAARDAILTDWNSRLDCAQYD